jgi:hypothetical protein
LWPSFIASGTFYAAGTGLDGLARGYASNLAGIVYAAATLAIVNTYFGGGVVALSIVVGVFMFLSSGNGSSTEFEAEQQPSNVGSIHTHGTIEVTIDGQQIDFSQEQYQLQADAFHFENREGTRCHVHARGVTLEYAMATLEIAVTESTVTFQGTTYRDSDSNTSVTVTVNGESITPSEYVLQEGDRIRIIAERS